jgi:hypothetical protein
MLKDYSWAQNKQKLDRALHIYPENEEKCKEYYKSLGGLILEATSEVKPVEMASTTPPEAPQEATMQEQPKVEVSPYQCKLCSFIGKNERSLKIHFSKNHK